MISSSVFRSSFKSSCAAGAGSSPGSVVVGSPRGGFQLTLNSLAELSAENSSESSQSTISENIEEEEEEELLEIGSETGR